MQAVRKPRQAQFVLSRRHLILAGGFSIGVVGGIRSALAADSADRGCSPGAIHQEPVINARRARVYQALTQSALFDRLMALSDAVKSGAVERKRARIDARPGGSFSLFGGYITGRFIELVPDAMIVQAWRVGSWGSGVYSAARFELVEAGEHTKIVFDHTGFPPDEGGHLAQGWSANYWNPLNQLFM